MGAIKQNIKITTTKHKTSNCCHNEAIAYESYRYFYRNACGSVYVYMYVCKYILQLVAVRYAIAGGCKYAYVHRDIHMNNKRVVYE